MLRALMIVAAMVSGCRGWVVPATAPLEWMRYRRAPHLARRPGCLQDSKFHGFVLPAWPSPHTGLRSAAPGDSEGQALQETVNTWINTV